MPFSLPEHLFAASSVTAMRARLAMRFTSSRLSDIEFLWQNFNKLTGLGYHTHFG